MSNLKKNLFIPTYLSKKNIDHFVNFCTVFIDKIIKRKYYFDKKCSDHEHFKIVGNS